MYEYKSYPNVEEAISRWGEQIPRHYLNININSIRYIHNCDNVSIKFIRQKYNLGFDYTCKKCYVLDNAPNKDDVIKLYKDDPTNIFYTPKDLERIQARELKLHPCTLDY